MITFLGRFGYLVVLLLCFVGSASALTRMIRVTVYLSDPAAYVMPSSPPGADGFEARYFDRPYHSLLHAVTGLIYMVLGPIQFLPAVRNRWTGFHRWSGRIWMLAALVGAISALLFVGQLPVWGDLSTNAAIIIATGTFLVALVQGYRAIRRRDIVRHREWMIRCFTIGLGIATFRLLVPVFMLPPIEASFTEAWEAAAWLGFVINLAAAEAWIHLTRRKTSAFASSRTPLRAGRPLAKEPA